MKRLIFVLIISFNSLAAIIIENQTTREIVFQLRLSNHSLSPIFRMPANTRIKDTLHGSESIRGFVLRDTHYRYEDPNPRHIEYPLPHSKHVPTLTLQEYAKVLHVNFKTDDEYEIISTQEPHRETIIGFINSSILYAADALGL